MIVLVEIPCPPVSGLDSATPRWAHRARTIKPQDPFLLRDVATVLLDCGLRPEECHRLGWEHIRHGASHIPFGKTAGTRHSIPLPSRSAALLKIRKSIALECNWVFSALTESGHIGQSLMKKRHAAVCKLAEIAPLPVYPFRHACPSHP